MEMTFPSIGLRQNSRNRSCDHRTILAQANARQASSQTVCLVRQAEATTVPPRNDAEQRIQYFADSDGQQMAVRGEFWRNATALEKSEFGVYQGSLANFKHHRLEQAASGETTNLAGQGTLRTL